MTAQRPFQGREAQARGHVTGPSPGALKAVPARSYGLESLSHNLEVGLTIFDQSGDFVEHATPHVKIMLDANLSNSGPQLTVAEMTELAGGLAHELRNPLSTMMVNLKLLAENLQDADASFEDTRRRALLKVGVLRHEAERLQSLFDDFLNLTSPYHLELVERDLNEIVNRLVEFLESMLLSHGIRIAVHRPDTPVRCVVDEKLIGQALLNLIVNARDAMPDGGEITLATSTDTDWAVIRVTDTGMGIREQDRDRILRPFFSTKAKGGGLGLSITRRIALEHGGELSFSSTPGGGTEFLIRLPLDRRPSGKDSAG